jgi:hypothetical protein
MATAEKSLLRMKARKHNEYKADKMGIGGVNSITKLSKQKKKRACRKNTVDPVLKLQCYSVQGTNLFKLYTKIQFLTGNNSVFIADTSEITF